MTATIVLSFFFGLFVLAFVACAFVLVRHRHGSDGGRGEQWSSVRRIMARRDD